MKLAAKTTEELRQIHQEALEQYEDFKSLHLQLNMARGKPCAEQLDLALGVLEALHARSEFANSNGDDCRNYGVWNGLPEMRAIFSKMMDVPAELIILGNNSSLQMMFDCTRARSRQSHAYNPGRCSRTSFAGWSCSPE